MHPVRVALRLLTACAALQLGQAASACWLLLRYGRLVDELGPWSRNEATLIEAVYTHLTGAAVLAAGLSALLVGIALAVPRRTPYTRSLVGWALLLVTVSLLLGVVYGPDAVLLPDNQSQLDHLQPLLPLWYTAQQGLTVTLVIVGSATAVVRLSSEAAGEYYLRHDPTATWRGFTSWLDVRFQD
ncbi:MULTISPECIES: hypothetical protein [Dactylosporangium]|uniref:Uncharacterized protein n=2 Tax=Dactylosporangium TaxID=35753 RepID=A0A9W6KJV9_9ACTN|nr:MULTISPECIES: hypothetical protein [Dactylosporangium]UAB92075.1 hypothetical protein Dvina_27170 [Dactylosporangium vinaceum]UWZ48938.1 hypothetical protein Dmats_22610 [Dactylosporangium matsuzakiense]GLL00834.1 hypothetical protein GCM10017581_025750 [Dactylosporangium matsuzakiense]